MEVNIKKTIFEWHMPNNDKERRLFKEHKEKLAEVRRTGKCPCGAPVAEGTPNRLLNLGYLYGMECLRCR